jgi:manganese-dependent inorganic pyrophosphatase
MQIILVDHNETAQALGALEEADLVEVVDHHRLGNAPTKIPIPFTVDPVGSTSTLVSERIAEANLQPPTSIAGLLLAGLLADTLILKSPTTTQRDWQAADRLAKWAQLGKRDALAEGNGIPFGDYVAFGEALLAAGAGLAVRNVEEILSSDLKIYEGGGVRFGIAQVEVATLHELEPRLPEITAGLAALGQANGLEFTVLMVTNVVRGHSRLVLAGRRERLNDLPYDLLPDGTLDAPDVVSRKKQLLPSILGLLE